MAGSATSRAWSCAGLPPGIAGRYSPGPAIAGLGDWETRLAAVAAARVAPGRAPAGGHAVVDFDPLERVARHRRPGAPRRARGTLAQPPRPVHGGVTFAPVPRASSRSGSAAPSSASRSIRRRRASWPSRPSASGGLTLMLDYGIFYEFVPVEDLAAARPRRHTVADVELDRPYAVVLTTPAGLWSYLLGDTVRFVARDPLRLVITGRVRHFVNAFGENVIVEEVERALVEAVPPAPRRKWWSSPWRRAIPRRGSRAAATTGWWSSAAAPGARGVRPGPRRGAVDAERRLPHQAARATWACAAPRVMRAAAGHLPPLDAGGRQAGRPAQGAARHERPRRGRGAARRRGPGRRRNVAGSSSQRNAVGLGWLRARVIRLSGLSKTYPNGTHALRRVHLHVARGQVVTLLGRSGAGKSTLLRCVNGLTTPSAGEVVVGGLCLDGR